MGRSASSIQRGQILSGSSLDMDQIVPAITTASSHCHCCCRPSRNRCRSPSFLHMDQAILASRLCAQNLRPTSNCCQHSIHRIHSAGRTSDIRWHTHLDEVIYTIDCDWSCRHLEHKHGLIWLMEYVLNYTNVMKTSLKYTISTLNKINIIWLDRCAKCSWIHNRECTDHQLLSGTPIPKCST